jgi:hypothetical protein
MDSDIVSGHTIELKIKKWSQRSFDWARFKGHGIGLIITLWIKSYVIDLRIMFA